MSTTTEGRAFEPAHRDGVAAPADAPGTTDDDPGQLELFPGGALRAARGGSGAGYTGMDPQLATREAGHESARAGWPFGAPAEHQGGAADGASDVPGRRGVVWARRALAVIAAGGIVNALAPARADALFGLPTIVFDPTAVGKLVTQIGELRSQLGVARSHVNAFVANTRRLTSPYAWRNPGSAVATVNSLVASGQALSYSSVNLGSRLATTFPGYSYDPLTADAAMRAQRERTLSTVIQQAMAGQATGVQLGESIARLQTMKAQLAGAGTAQQVAELNATIGVLQAEETTLLRQQLLAQQSAQAVVQADMVNRELQGAAAVRRNFGDQARALATSPPVRPALNPAAYAF